jgi:hypothetical protein
MKRLLSTITLIGVIALLPFTASTPAAVSRDTGRHWIAEMKQAPRGPFKRLRWFCNDGTVHPPKPYPCTERGGGHQHGEWSDKTQQLRADGYKIANLLAGVDAKELTVEPDFLDTYAQILVEKYLIAADDGWILRQALFYRGAIQEESERDGARALLLELIRNNAWLQTRYPALRIGARLLPHGEETASVQKVRQVSKALADQDPGFMPVRVKIHGAPDAGDAQRVHDYAARVSDAELKAKYEALATDIDKIYNTAPLPDLLNTNAAIFSSGPWLQEILREAARAYGADTSADHRYGVTARLLADLRDALRRVRSTSARLRVLDLSLVVEADNFRAGVELRQALPQATRSRRVQWLAAAAEAAYGTGMINARERAELQKSLKNLAGGSVPLETYKQVLTYLGRVPGWGTQGLRLHFYASMQTLNQIEPMAHLFIQDQLRGSPLLFFGQVLDSLLRDANRLAGVRHKLFGQEIGVGFRALNPGLARGVLHANPDLSRLDELEPDGIYLLPETVSDLPPVAGILTAGEGNPLSHVQLLARNLGIPNVGVDEGLLPQLRQQDGTRVVLAVSPAGLVQLEADSERWDGIFGQDKANQEVLIKPDLAKLDLSVKTIIGLDDLRAGDSGRTVGPKAAKLGELRHHYPEAVSRGLAIPFGVFRQEVMDQPYKQSGQTLFEWMTAQYDHMQELSDGSVERREFTERFRAELYEAILRATPSSAFKERLRATLRQTFGSDKVPGLFVRSDTNVEDLPGFTGAGLNLTLPNVVGFDNLMAGISRVWASPFTARAFAWRQSHMADPEHVYTSILLLESVPVDKSGVLVTQDIDTGDRQVLSVAVNEGVGGAVDGQAAESLRIDRRDGTARLLATATAPWRRVPAKQGGVTKLPVSGSDTVLQPGEVTQLIALAQELPRRFPAITDDQGNPAPADIEFGFLDGKLRLFQLRPFLESRRARGSAYLVDMDRTLKGNLNLPVNMREVPAS